MFAENYTYVNIPRTHHMYTERQKRLSCKIFTLWNEHGYCSVINDSQSHLPHGDIVSNEHRMNLRLFVRILRTCLFFILLVKIYSLLLYVHISLASENANFLLLLTAYYQKTRCTGVLISP